ncbi:MAG: GlxA family transcriptional regulator [Gammaproteobacteria bacterium]|nr:GlxA family transcriptional regulator [Gammaproteobacteria bacterium]MDE2262918.1 GlxA family transcriptional regulator [Gammaproteobacteria bacterium]
MPHSLGSQKLSPPERAARPPLRVGIILAEHFTLSAFAVFIDHLRLAADEGDRSRPMHVQWSIMSGRREPVRASCGVTLQPTSGLLPPASIDYVVVVGGILHAGPQIDETTIRYLREVGATRTPLIGICTGSFVLCRAGLMEGRRSCVNWYHYQDFREAFPGHDVVADRLFVADGPRITCAGGAGSAALATHLIEQHLGRAQAQKATQVLLFDRPRQGSDAQPHPPLSEGISEPRVRRALLLMEQNLTRPISIGAIADELGVSTRQLERLCRENVSMGPASLYRQLRMRYASWLIQNTDRSMTDIAIETGFADCAHFSRQFKDAYGISPSTHRLQPNRVANSDAARSRVFD